MIILQEFMKLLGISVCRLAEVSNGPVSQMQDILQDRRKITADTSFRLARFFGVSDHYFLDIQNDINVRNLKNSDCCNSKEKSKKSLDRSVPRLFLYDKLKGI